MNNDDRRILELTRPMDHAELTRILHIFTERYRFLRTTSIGSSILGRDIPVLVLGKGPRNVLYVGAHHGMEWITASLLLRFVNEFCEYYSLGKSLYHVSLPFLLEHYTLHILPMLNPDGVEYQINGITHENPMYNRIVGMNGGSEDLSRWQANARGVDLNHNYDAGFAEYKQLESEHGIPCGAPSRYSGQEPCSEPEVSGLCNYIRFQKDLRFVLSLHTQGEEIYYRSGGKQLSGAYEAASRLARLCGYRLADAEGLAAYGGLTDWCIQRCEIPALTLECGKGENPLPLSELFPIYVGLREALFTAPMLY